MDAPQHGVAPGQAAVLYDGDRVLGGGWIAEAERLGELRRVGGASWQEEIGMAAELVSHSDAAPAVSARALDMDSVSSVVAPRQISRSSAPVVERVSAVKSPRPRCAQPPTSVTAPAPSTANRRRFG